MSKTGREPAALRFGQPSIERDGLSKAELKTRLADCQRSGLKAAAAALRRKLDKESLTNE